MLKILKPQFHYRSTQCMQITQTNPKIEDEVLLCWCSWSKVFSVFLQQPRLHQPTTHLFATFFEIPCSSNISNAVCCVQLAFPWHNFLKGGVNPKLSCLSIHMKWSPSSKCFISLFCMALAQKSAHYCMPSVQTRLQATNFAFTCSRDNFEINFDMLVLR